MKKLNENVAYAKSILNKLGITQDSPEWQDFLKIREICGNNTGYVGILTRLRFSDGVTDIDELQSIFDVLKNSKIDVNKLLKLKYEEILDQFYDELHINDEGGKDLELVYKDETYSYYKVYTYKGILKIGSPAWCLKTKSHWDKYQEKYQEQWVVIHNEDKNKLISPDNYYLDNYSNKKKPWIRYGVSTLKEGNNISWEANNDNNTSSIFHPKSQTFYGVMCTVINLSYGRKDSYYNYFKGCEKVNEIWLRVTDLDGFLERMRLKDQAYRFEKDDEIYVNFSKTYSFIPVMLVFNTRYFYGFFPTDIRGKDPVEDGPVNFGKKTIESLILNFIKDKDDTLFDGIKLSYGMITMGDIERKSGKRFLAKYDKWLIYDRNENYYLVVNTDVNNGFQVMSRSLISTCVDMVNPMSFYVSKKDFKVLFITPQFTKDYHREVINYIKNKIVVKKIEVPTPAKEPEKTPEKKVGGFLDFFKKRKG